MNFRIDSQSLRIRINLEEATRLANGEVVSETYAAMNLSLELKVDEGDELTLSQRANGLSRVEVFRQGLDVFIKRILGAKSKKNELGIRGIILTPEGQCELILEVDFFDLRRRK